MSHSQSDKTKPVRSRCLTEKGRLYELGESQKRRSQLDTKIRTQLRELEFLIEDNKVEDLRSEFEVTDQLFREYLKVHSKCQILLQPVDDRDDFSTASIDKRLTSMRRKVAEVLEESNDLGRNIDETTKSNKKSLGSHKSRTIKSSERSRSSRSISIHIAMEKAKLAELQIEAKFMEKQQKLEQQSKSLSLTVELAKAKAKIEAYECMDEDNRSQFLQRFPFDEEDKTNMVADYINTHQQITTDREKVKIETYDAPLYDLHDEEEQMKGVHLSSRLPNAAKMQFKTQQDPTQSNPIYEAPPAKLVECKLQTDRTQPTNNQQFDLTHLINHMQAPTVEMDVFSGNCMDYPYFITMFSEVVERRIADPRGRLTRLLKYLKDEAKELVQSCVYLPTDEGYKKARELLDKNYGDRYRILSEYRKELRSWPTLKPHDGQAFRKFYSFLIKYKTTMRSVDNFDRYDSPELIQRLQLCLPNFLQERWNRTSHSIRKSQRREAGIDHFVSFMENEMLLVNDPNFSKNALLDLKGEHPRVTPKKFVKSMLTTGSKPCPKCIKNHDLDECKEYLKMNVYDRKKFVFLKRLCFSCYDPTNDDHNGFTCMNKRKCNICNESHLTGFHGYQRKKRLPDGMNEQTKGLSVNCSKIQMEVISLNIVPVIITHPSTPVRILTKALLDNGSQGTFIHEGLLKELNVPTVSTTISIKTMSGETTESRKSIENL